MSGVRGALWGVLCAMAAMLWAGLPAHAAECLAPGADGRFRLETPAGVIAGRSLGTGPALVFVPALGRGPSDFDAVAKGLVGAGYRVVLPDPRGIGGSKAALQGATLADLGRDLLNVAAGLCTGPVTIVGHAFGGRVARAAAELDASQVAALVLLSLNGERTPAPDLKKRMGTVVAQGFRREEVRLKELEALYFAPGNDARAWLRGWYPFAAAAQNKVVEQSAREAWRAGGSAPILIVQAARDPIAPLVDAEAYRHAFAGRVHLVALDQAGHALLPEQPRAVTALILAYLAGRTDDLARIASETIVAPERSSALPPRPEAGRAG